MRPTTTCFGHHYAHLQENKGPVTALGVFFWFCWMWLVAVVGRCVIGCERFSHRTTHAPHNNMFRVSLCQSSGDQRPCYCIWCVVLVLLDVVTIKQLNVETIKTKCDSVNHTRFPKKDRLPDWARRYNKITEGDLAESLYACVVAHDCRAAGSLRHCSHEGAPPHAF